jgi:hypothetical protein
MNERITGRCVPVLRADGEQILVTIAVAKNTEFLKKYGMRILDETLLHATPETFSAPIQELPKRRPMLVEQEPVAVVSTQEFMDQTPEVPADEEVFEQEIATEEEQAEIPTEETTTTKTRRK